MLRGTAAGRRRAAVCRAARPGLANQDSTSSRLKISVWSLYEKISP
jgi:hypothetical protein